jgi:hypothetical protein
MSPNYQISQVSRRSYSVTQTEPGGFPFSEDLTLRASDRVGFTMADSIGSNDIDILTPSFKSSVGGRERRTAGGVLERVFDGGSYTMYFKMRQTEALGGTVQFMKMGNNWNTRRGFAMYGVGGADLTFCAGDGTNSSFHTAVTNIDTTLVNAGWFQVFIEVDKATDRLRMGVYKLSDDSLIGTASNVDISSWVFNDDDNYDVLRFFGLKIAVCDVKKFSGLKTLAQCKDNTYTTDLQFHFPDLWSKADVSGNAHHCVDYGTGPSTDDKFYSNVNSYLLDYGYSLYRSTSKYLNPTGTAYQDICVPHQPDGTPVVMTIPDPVAVNFVKVGEFDGDLTGHNMADSYLNIPVASWDKSSTTIYEDAVRSSLYYLSGTPNRWHTSELDYLMFSFNCKTSHKGTNFFRTESGSAADGSVLHEIFSYGTDYNGSNLNYILNFTKDYDQLNGALQLYCDASAVADIDLRLAGVTGQYSFQIYWGDGTKRGVFTMDDTQQTINKVYDGTETYLIYIFKPETVSQIKLINAGADIAPSGGDVGEYAKATNLTVLDLYPNLTIPTGSIDNLSKAITRLHFHRDMKTVVTGTITPFSALVEFEMTAAVDGAFNATNHPNIELIWMEGDMTCTVDVTNMTKLEQLESYADNSYATGSLDNCTNINHICYGTPNDFHGSLSNKANFEYLDHQNGTGVITLDIATVPNAWCIRSRNCVNEITGDTSGNNKLEILFLYLDNSSVTKPSTVAHMTELCQLRGDFWNFTVTEVNQILADMWANRDIGKTRFTTTRLISIADGTSAAPTGQGIIDKAALEAYRSPNDDPAYDLWTIVTN